MFNRLLQLLMILTLVFVDADDLSLTTLDNGIGEFLEGPESTMTDFASLKADPNEKELPGNTQYANIYTITQLLGSHFFSFFKTTGIPGLATS